MPMQQPPRSSSRPATGKRRRELSALSAGLLTAGLAATVALTTTGPSNAAVSANLAADPQPSTTQPASSGASTGSDVTEPASEPAIGESRGIVPAPGKGRRLKDFQNHPSSGHPHVTGHLDHGDQLWPPTPEGATKVRDLSDPDVSTEQAMARESAYAGIESRFDDHQQTRSLRGRRMTRLEIVEIADKGSTTLKERRFQYFDRAANSTVTVVENVSNGDLTVETVPAEVSQPELSAGEVELAVTLAKSYFVQRGQRAAQSLQGFGIQAYPASGTKQFRGRVVYVSLHANADAPPDYVAWVNLSNQRVLEARKEVQR